MKPYPGAKLVVRMARYGCTNRPFYHIVVTWNRFPRDRKVREQLGFYDRLPNMYGEQVLGLNLDRIRHYFKHGAEFSRPVLQLLGIIGYFPIHPYTLLEAKRVTRRREELEQKVKAHFLEEKSDQSEEGVKEEISQSEEKMESESLETDSTATDSQTSKKLEISEELLSEYVSKATKKSVFKL
ncbi:small ribosomal subunit protein bS16m-like [Crassostrea virginica]